MLGKYHLASVLDMLRFYAHSVLRVSRDLASFETLEVPGFGISWNSDSMKESLQAAESHLLSLGLPVSAAAAVRFRELIERSASERDAERSQKPSWRFWSGGTTRKVSATDLSKHAYMLNQAIRDELASLYCFAIAAEKAPFFVQKEPLFGNEVEAKLPMASEDISEAGKCIATARFTAGVFHLMRVLEIGTREFAGKLGIAAINSKGQEKNWQNFLDEANKAIKGISAPADQEKARRYTAISAHLYNVKVAWRNEVMHPKQTYTEEEAIEVFWASKAFIRELVSVL